MSVEDQRKIYMFHYQWTARLWHHIFSVMNIYHNSFQYITLYYNACKRLSPQSLFYMKRNLVDIVELGPNFQCFSTMKQIHQRLSGQLVRWVDCCWKGKPGERPGDSCGASRAQQSSRAGGEKTEENVMGEPAVGCTVQLLLLLLLLGPAWTGGSSNDSLATRSELCFVRSWKRYLSLHFEIIERNIDF